MAQSLASLALHRAISFQRTNITLLTGEPLARIPLKSMWLLHRQCWIVGGSEETAPSNEALSES